MRTSNLSWASAICWSTLCSRLSEDMGTELFLLFDLNRSPDPIGFKCVLILDLAMPKIGIQNSGTDSRSRGSADSFYRMLQLQAEVLPRRSMVYENTN
ncbi:hypothetical protein OPQ81_011760 [Rhizoctonia solani]|nr:hypothetical protein OPQ81_011760 [Rhizoctonia solani]